MLPYQMSRNCEKFVYAHSIVKASIRLPRSRKWLGLRMPCMAGFGASRTRKNVTNAKAESPAPTVKEMPNIEEYHFGSSDINQSTDANVSVSTIIRRPLALHLRRESSVYGERSCANRSESTRMRQTHSVQIGRASCRERV